MSRFGLGGLSADASAARIVNPRELKRLFLYPTTVLFAPASSLTDNPLRLIMKLQKMAQGCKEILTQVNHQRNWSLAHSGKVRPVNCLNSIFCDEAFHNRHPGMAGLAVCLGRKPNACRLKMTPRRHPWCASRFTRGGSSSTGWHIAGVDDACPAG